MLKINTMGVVAVAAVSLFGCGGGGSATNTSASTGQTIKAAAVQGAYTGVNSANTEYNVLVLEDGSFYAYYGNVSGNMLLVEGIAVGQSTSANSSWNVNYNDFLHGQFYATGTGTGSYTASSFSGSNSEAGQTSSFSLTTPAATTYTYTKPALLSTITGSWNGSATDGNSNSWTIAPDGSFIGSSSAGCSYAGNFTPRPGGNNVFNVTVTFGSNCGLVAKQASGVALTYALSNGQTEMVSIVANTASNFGVALFGVR